jgi:hypothetical protein
MTEEERAELHVLSEAKDEALRASYGFEYTNVYGLSAEELKAVARRRAELEAAVAEATGRYRGFLSRLEERAALTERT